MAIKFYGDFFWNICDFGEKESTQDGARGLHKATGRDLPPGHAPLPCGYLVGHSEPFFTARKIISR